MREAELVASHSGFKPELTCCQYWQDGLFCPDLYCDKTAPIGPTATCGECGEWSCPDHAHECCKEESAIQLMRYEMRDAGVAITATTPHQLLVELDGLDIAGLLKFVSSQYYNTIVDEFGACDELYSQWAMLRRTMFSRMRSGAQ